jgi:hypothetical protein
MAEPDGPQYVVVEAAVTQLRNADAGERQETV